MLKESVSPLVGNLNKANSVEHYQQEYQKSMAKDGHFESAPDYYVAASGYWTDKNIFTDPLNFRESSLHFNSQSDFEIIRN